VKLSARLIAAAVLALAVAAAPADGRERRPGFIEVGYHKEKGAQGTDTDVIVFGRRIESLKIKASYAGKTATAIARESNISSTDFNGHGWVPRHDSGRRDLLNTMEKSINATGAVTLKLIAKNGGGTTKQNVEIVFSQCHFDPPIYPFTCVVDA
jgi:hypothetical protein